MKPRETFFKRSLEEQLAQIAHSKRNILNKSSAKYQRKRKSEERNECDM